MVYSGAELVYKTKDHVGEHRSRGNTPDSVVLEYIQQGVGLMSGEILALRDDFFASYQDITLTGEREYDLNLDIERVFDVENVTNSSNPSGSTPVRYSDRFRNIRNRNVDWYMTHRKIGFPGKPNGVVVRVWYPKIPRRLFYGTVVSSTSTETIITSATLGRLSKEDDCYNGMFLVSDDGQFRVIDDYVASNGKFTLGSAWSTNPTSTTVCSLGLPFATQYQDLIHLRAGILWRADLDLPLGDLESQYERTVKPLKELLNQRQTQTEKQVKHINR